MAQRKLGRLPYVDIGENQNEFQLDQTSVGIQTDSCSTMSIQQDQRVVFVKNMSL
jgi:hypothetical protein